MLAIGFGGVSRKNGLGIVMARTLVSVIIPTFNDGKERLEKTIFTVLQQTYPTLEIIVSDDGSSGPAFAGLDEELHDDRIRWLKNEHGGVARTRNAAIEVAKGDYIAFLDSGDWWQPDKIEKQIEVLSHNPDAVLVYTSAVTHDPYGRTAGLVATKQGSLYRDLLIGQPVVGSCSGAMVPRHVLDQVGGFYVKSDIPEDQELWLRISRLGRIICVPEYLVHLEIGLASRSSDPLGKMRPYQHFLEIHADEIVREGLVETAWSNYHVSIADKFFSMGRFLPGMKHTVMALSTKWTRAGALRMLMGFFALLGPRAYSYTKHIYRNRS